MPHDGAGTTPRRQLARWTAVVGLGLIVAVSVAFWLVAFGATTGARVVGVVVGVVAAASTASLKAAERAGRLDGRWWPTLGALSLAGLFGFGVVLSVLGLRDLDRQVAARIWHLGDPGLSGGDPLLVLLLFVCGPLAVALFILAVVRIPPYTPLASGELGHGMEKTQGNNGNG